MQKQQLHTLVLGCKFMKICSMIVCFYKQQQQQQKNYYQIKNLSEFIKTLTVHSVIANRPFEKTQNLWKTEFCCRKNGPPDLSNYSIKRLF